MTVNYDFQNLSFDDFERLAADLLGKVLNVRLESFKTGRDGGIDLRYSQTAQGDLIVQCKRYLPGAFSRLLRDLEKKEVPKLVKLKPQRYIIFTSCGLSPENKDELASVLSPYCTGSGDVYGASEINALIRSNGEIEKRHFKLWMSSTEILKKILNAGIYNYSQFEVDRLKKEVSRYVVHDGFYRALELLDKRHHCLILGMPGIGKTTAARLLLAHYLNEEYSVVSVTGDVNEAWKVIEAADVNEKIVVYYDDFLGQVGFSEKLGKNEDRRLLSLLEHCEQSKTKRFILTTREYLFDQALTQYEPLSRAIEDIQKAVVKLQDYTPLVRARLLINQLSFSNISEEQVGALIEDGTYTRLTQHVNFVPRLIERICSDKFVDGKSPAQFVSDAIGYLNDPSSVWKHPFSQLTSEARVLLHELASLNGEHEKSGLHDAFEGFRKRSGAPELTRFFDEVLREVEGSFTSSQKIAIRGGGTTWIVRFINPSAREFVLTDLISREAIFAEVLASACFFKQTQFWREARTTFSGVAVKTVAEKFRAAILAESLRLIQSPEVAADWVSIQHGLDIQAAPKVVTRLREVMTTSRALNIDCKEKFAEILEKSPELFESLFSSADVFWLPEVTSEFLNSAQAHIADWKSYFTKILPNLRVHRRYGDDLQSIRYHLEACDRILDAVSAEHEVADLIRVSFVNRVVEVSLSIDDDLTSDEIEEAIKSIDSIKALAPDDRLDAAEIRLKNTFERVTLREDQKRASEDEEDLLESYKDKAESVVDAGGPDIDGLFTELRAYVALKNEASEP